MANSAEITERFPITCETTGKLLARMDQYGIWLWCKACHTEHRILFSGTSTSTENWNQLQQHCMLSSA